MRPQAGVGKLKHAPPLQAYELPWWGMLCAIRIPHLQPEAAGEYLARAGQHPG
jgi:hypothetical protein